MRIAGADPSSADDAFDEHPANAPTSANAHTATNITGLGLDVDISTPSLSVGKDFDVKISDGQYLVVEMNLSGQMVDLAIAVDQN